MKELYWPNTWTFHDRRRDFSVSSPGVYEIPEDSDDDPYKQLDRDDDTDIEYGYENVEEHYRDRGWLDPSEAPDDPGAQTAAAQSGTAGAEELSAAEGSDTPSGTSPAESDEAGSQGTGESEAGGAEAEEAGEKDEPKVEEGSFDAAAFAEDDHHQTVKAKINDGYADEHLEELREHEQNRDGDPRNGIMTALKQRQHAVENGEGSDEE
jgi:hypothetical protein